jgi:apolipoprotein D and lipocalin family protein
MKKISLALVGLIMSACSSLPPIKTVNHVDLERFMGDWYVIACIPTLIEKDIYNVSVKSDIIVKILLKL